jgi:hypothetical protein
MILAVFGIVLIFLGLVVSIVFWIPSIFDKSKVRAVMGRRYPLVYVFYVANGPILMLFGILLILWQKV